MELKTEMTSVFVPGSETRGDQSIVAREIHMYL